MAILQSWWDNTDPPALPHSGKQTAKLVDYVIETEKPRNKAQAYQRVSEVSGKSFEAVKQSHIRYEKSKRDKSG